MYEDYYDRIYKYARTLLLSKEDAEDVTEDTFIAAYQHFDAYDEKKSSPATWLVRIAHNKAVNLMRSAEYAKRAELPEDFEAGTDEDIPGQVERADEVLRLYAQLTPEEREFLNLRYVLELKDKEIATLLSQNEKTINKRYQRLLQKCREYL